MPAFIAFLFGAFFGGVFTFMVIFLILWGRDL